MKKFIPIIILTILISVFYSGASELKFSPENPKSGDTVKINFSGNTRFNSKEKIDLQIYSFDTVSVNPLGMEAELTKNGSNWTGSFVLPMHSVYCMFKIFATGDYYDIIDNNYGEYWELVVYSDGKSVRNANLKAALSRLGSISANIDRQPDFYGAIKLLEKELNLYPDNITAELGLVTTLFDAKKINSDDFKEKLDKIAHKKINPENESEVRTKVRAMYALNQKEDASELEKNYAMLHPTSEIAEDLLIAEISSAESMGIFVKASDKFFRNFPESMSRERVLLAYVSAYMQSSKVKELVADLDSIQNVHGYIYARIAKNLFEYFKEKDLLNVQANKELLTGLLDKAETVNEKQKAEAIDKKPRIYTPGEWLDILDIQAGTVKEIRGEIYAVIEPVRSLEYYNAALVLLRSNSSESLYENYIDLLVKFGDSQKALNVSEDAILKGKLSDKISDFHREASRNLLYLNDSLYNLKADSLYQKSKLLKREVYLNEILNQSEFQYVLETLDGTYVDFRDLKSKVAVFSFFATWCDPCKTMFPALEDIYELYSGNTDVEIVAVNTLENQKFNIDELKKFIVQNDISFPIVRDKMDLIPRQMGINGLPTIAFFDKNSRLRFLVKGFANNEKLLEDVVGRIEFLLTYGE